VQAGRPFADLVESGGVPVARLTEVHRHAGDIPMAARQVLAGGPFEAWSNRADGQVFVINVADAQAAQARIVDIVTRTLPIRYSLAANEVQVLSPRRGQSPLACNALNDAIRFAVSGRRRGTPLAPGDRVVVTYNLAAGCRNGDLGTVVAHPTEGSAQTTIATAVRRKRAQADVVHVALDDAPTIAWLIETRDLELAYALTVHKYQGSQAPIVVVAWHSCHGSWLPDRSVLYTAVSRAQRVCVVVGERSAVRTAIRRGPQRKRTTVLRALVAADGTVSRTAGA
jgi:exodeoxyribonuclease V alpha subunit